MDLQNVPTTILTLRKPAIKAPKFLKVLLTILIVIIVFALVTATSAYFIVFIPAKHFYDQALTLKVDANRLKAAINNKDLTDAKNQLDTIDQKVTSLSKDFQKFSYAKAIPRIKEYYADGEILFSIAKESISTGNILIKAVEPYQDFLGLKGSSTDSSQTTQDRINFLTQSVEGLLPHLDTIEKNLDTIDTQLAKIDASRYPETIKNYEIKNNIIKAQGLVSEIHTLVKNGKPILTYTSWLLGKDKPRTYFLMFQNDAELRPTGGFWTAYGIMKVDKGKITPLASSDIYTLDAKFNSTIPAPRPIKAYHINVPYLNLRDMNLSPDFQTSIEEFLGHYYKITGSKDKVDAVIAIDTQVLVDLVRVLGKIGVSEYGNFYADPDKRCDGCPQIIYQLEWMAGRPRNYIELNRKGFLAPLMQSILLNAMGAEKTKIAPLAQAAFKDISDKHILFYFTDPKIQAAANAANITGNITQTDTNTDYFHLNDANMSSAKTNLFLTQKIKHEIRNNNGKVEHKVSITYTNPSKASNCNLERGDLCLNAPKYRDWFRFYTPIGSELVKMTGTEVDPVKYEELGKQVFEGFYGDKYPLYAMNSTKVTVQYFSSVKPAANYTLLLQKQPGTKPIEYEVWVNGTKLETFSWTSDKTLKFAL